MVGLVRESEEMEAVPGWPALAAGLTVFFAALMLCLIFLRHARKENAPKKGQVLVRVPRGCTSTRGQGPLRFAVLSARRGGRRSVIVIVAALVLTLFVSLLSASAQSRSGQMESLYADSVLGGQVISFNGRKQTGLAVPTRDIQQLWKSGNLKDIFVSRSWPYEYTTEESLPDITPTTSVLKDKAVKILRMPRLSTVNSLSAAEEFYYTDRPEIRWLEGWDESCLSDESCPAVIESIYERLYEEENYVPSDYIYPVIVGSRFLEDNDLKPGDMLTLRLYMYLYVDSRELLVEWPVNFQIVGSFTSVGAKDNVYAPLSLWCSPEWLYGEGDKEMPSRDLGRIMNVDSLKKSLPTKIARKQFRCEEGENSVDYNIKGSFLTGVSILSSKGENIVLAKNKWYDWLFIFLPLLGMIFGVAFCGAIGGALSGLMCFSATVVNAVQSRTKLPLAGKIPLQILVTVVANGIWFGIYCLVVVAIFY